MIDGEVRTGADSVESSFTHCGHKNFIVFQLCSLQSRSSRIVICNRNNLSEIFKKIIALELLHSNQDGVGSNAWLQKNSILERTSGSAMWRCRCALWQKQYKAPVMLIFTLVTKFKSSMNLFPLPTWNPDEFLHTTTHVCWRLRCGYNSTWQASSETETLWDPKDFQIRVAWERK